MTLFVLVDDAFDDSSSQSSGWYSNLNYCSGDEYDPQVSPIRSKLHAISSSTHTTSSRFCRGENSSSSSQSYCLKQPNKDCVALRGGGATSKEKSGIMQDIRRLTRNCSLVDMRSQLLHRSLVEEVSKRRLFKTVGAVENIGFQDPYELSRKKTLPVVKNMISDGRRQKQQTRA